MKILVPAIPLALVVTFSLTAAQRLCGQYDELVLPPYTVYNNLWGQGDDPNGIQCTEATRISDKTIAWTTDFNWAGNPNQAKSFAIVALSFTPVQMSQVTSMPTEIEYEYESVDKTLVANVAYDMFLSSSSDGETYTYEVKVWLTTFGIIAPFVEDPMNPILANVTVAGVNFKLYRGMDSNVTVFTYVATANINRFNGDFKEFFTNLPDAKRLNDQYLVDAMAGTEPSHGKAELIVSKYSLAIIS